MLPTTPTSDTKPSLPHLAFGLDPEQGPHDPLLRLTLPTTRAIDMVPSLQVASAPMFHSGSVPPRDVGPLSASPAPLPFAPLPRFDLDGLQDSLEGFRDSWEGLKGALANLQKTWEEGQEVLMRLRDICKEELNRREEERLAQEMAEVNLADHEEEK